MVDERLLYEYVTLSDAISLIFSVYPPIVDTVGIRRSKSRYAKDDAQIYVYITVLEKTDFTADSSALRGNSTR